MHKPRSIISANEYNFKRKCVKREIMKKIKVAPSILSADFCKMAEAVENLKAWGADIVHCDIMDGVYVPNLTFGMPMVKALRRYTDMPLDAHLMITRPGRYVEQFCDAGADIVTFHPEACKSEEEAHRALKTIHAAGKKCGVAVNADMPAELALPYLDEIDMLVIMTVQAGFGGQSFKPECLKKAEILKAEASKRGLSFDIEFDGGVCPSNAAQCKDAGATVLVAGNAVFKSSDPASTVAAMQLPL